MIPTPTLMPRERVTLQRGTTVGMPDYVDAGGARLTYEEVVRRSGLGDPNDPTFDYALLESWMADNDIRPLINAVSGDKLSFVESREALGLGLFTAVLLGGSLLFVERRRPA